MGCILIWKVDWSVEVQTSSIGLLIKDDVSDLDVVTSFW